MRQKLRHHKWNLVWWPTNRNESFCPYGHGFDFTGSQRDFFSRDGIRVLVQAGHTLLNFQTNFVTTLVYDNNPENNRRFEIKNYISKLHPLWLPST